MPDSLEAWLARLESRHHSAIDLGLDRVHEVWRALGQPRPAGMVFTVAGTNGKGSTVAYLDHVLRGCGKSSGRYTSPHLLRFNERVVINGQEARSQDLVAAFEQVEAALDGVSLSYFEFTTLAAFVLMARAKLDCAVLEVGLGGRLDAVNIVDPDCALITRIGLDHQAYLGDSIEQIASEKAGIMRGGIPVISGDRTPPKVISSRARELGARLLQLGHDFEIRGYDGKHHLWVGDCQLPFPKPPLPGSHQQDNLATSLAAIETAYPGLLSHQQCWQGGLAEMELPGRLTTFEGKCRVLVDVGHNPLAAEVVAQHLQFLGSPRVHCVLAMLKDKDAAEVAKVLSRQVLRWYCAGLTGPRGRSGPELTNTLRKAVPGIYAASYESVTDALDSALDTASARDTVMVFGSFETAGKAFSYMATHAVGTAASQALIS